MNNSEVIKKIQEVVPADRVLIDEPMSAHTSFRIGGPADALVIVSNSDELAAVMKIVTDAAAEHLLIGNGSNLLVADDGYRGIMIKLGGDFESIKADDSNPTIVRAGGAKLLSSVSAFMTEHSLTGFEFASGIPGSIGGAMFMNAGAYGGEMKDIVKSVKIMTADGSKIMNLTNAEMAFGYRTSAIQNSGNIVLSAEFKMEEGNQEEIKARVAELQEKRNSKQPVNFPSAGSTFKRPVGGFAAALIDEAGLKGKTVGGAQVSEKHAGFVINAGGATAADVIELMRIIRKTVFDNSGIMLEPEVRMINCEL